MKNLKYYCPWCDYYLDDDTVRIDELNDPRCSYCNHPAESLPDPNDGAYDTLEEKRL